MSKKLSQAPKTAEIVEDYNSLRLESKNNGEKYNAKDREVSRKKNNLPCDGL